MELSPNLEIAKLKGCETVQIVKTRTLADANMKGFTILRNICSVNNADDLVAWRLYPSKKCHVMFSNQNTDNIIQYDHHS